MLRKNLIKQALYQGMTSQAAEKLNFEVGLGFIPGIKATESTRASAPEVCLPRISSQNRVFRSLFSRADKANRTNGTSAPANSHDGNIPPKPEVFRTQFSRRGAHSALIRRSLARHRSLQAVCNTDVT